MTTQSSHSQTVPPQARTAPLPDFVEIEQRGLYRPEHEHDACGVGVVANVRGERSHTIIEQGLEVLVNLGHRGACGCDPETGDGAGILLQMPDTFFQKAARQAEIKLPPEGSYAVGMCFLPNDPRLRAACEKAIEGPIVERGMKALGWRDVPVDPMSTGSDARSLMPRVRQIFVEAAAGLDSERFERRLYAARKSAEREVAAMAPAGSPEARTLFAEFYVCSFSARTIVYKGMFKAGQIRNFYPDLSDPAMVSAFALVHSRFSTNTLGSWKLAHPYRFIAHNGEINTVRGNRNWMAAREKSLRSWLLGADSDHIAPVCEPDASDTASLDNAFELLWMGGRPVEHAMAMLIPAAWHNHESMPPEVKAFYEYHASLMEPWDGPALVAFTDGVSLGAVLDRNGLRPFRYTVTKDGLLVMASETGVLDIAPERVEYKARLQPGRMFLVNFEQGRIVEHEEVIGKLARRQPYARWLEENRVTLDDLPKPRHVPDIDLKSLVTRQVAFGYSSEDLRLLIAPMAVSGHEPVGSMGHDAPLAALSDRPQNLFAYFKQLFAQVSNPPLDAIREELVTQMAVPVGRRGGLFDETPEHCRMLRIDHPILRNEDLARIKAADIPGARTTVISTLFPVRQGAAGMRRALDRIRSEAFAAAREGSSIVVLSDRGVDAENAFVPSLLATGAVHHRLIRQQTRTQLDIVVESGEPREVHHFACLFSYGASAVNPYLALETLAGIREAPAALNEPGIPEQTKAEHNYCKAVEKGVLKVMSKMGISTLQGYVGAQIFEALGLDQQFVDENFTWTASRIGGIGADEVCEDVLANHARAYPEMDIPANLTLDLGGLYLWRGTGERHMWNPETIALLQDAVGRNDPQTFAQFEQEADAEAGGHITVRGLLDFDHDPQKEIPLDQVEPATQIVKRFASGAISLGSISREAHETLAIAMNRIGARSNTGEGGEDYHRYTPDPNGDSRSSRMKQVASGRFGVTANYLVNATDLQIKMAQGSKPGEGGQLPGHKISDYVGFIRRTTPGVELISPSPHHDIYSIEDLAQLIHDLKNINPDARIHVKLVSEVGVGIIAAGVAKGKGDVVLISGDSGGTGASPLSSIKHAGLPWELGLAETQQVLVENGLRGRIVVQTDGQIKTSRDVAIAALLGADEWGIATASLVTLGCIMLRKCHLNTCSVGIATQDEELRKKFAGTPEATVNYFMFLAEGLRKHMAKLGFRTVNEMIGHTEKLKQRNDITHWKARGLDLSRMLLKRPVQRAGDTLHNHSTQDHGLKDILDHQLIRAAMPAIERKQRVEKTFAIRNSDRAAGAMLSGKIARKYGEDYLPDGTINFTFKGSAGQSFGAFLAGGVTFRLEGDSNDYFAKGLSGGRIVIVPPAGSTFIPEKNIIIGNVALYGATGGEAYIRGVAGERFCVRNSAAIAVVEGLGDHGCEYMTGGFVAVIGKTGRNFAAGMSGGIAYVLDEDGTFKDRFNPGMAALLSVGPGTDDESQLRKMLHDHVRYTGSTVARDILAGWASCLPKFRKIFPHDYARVLKERAHRDAAMKRAEARKVPAGAEDIAAPDTEQKRAGG
jgi:glutamate synthase domain-containing protein 2/glutamate synthase domain-containing protein 1/glutamate synthase domain-containing protein 3